jgi:eukaryotic-like serine/threonine-protein kinase
VVNLSAFLDGKYQPHDSKERLELIEACRFRKRYLAAARLYADVFAAEPKLAADPRGVHRFNAACAAALAGTGQSHDAGKLKDEERALLRKQAVDWLRADLATYSTRLQGGNAQERNMVQKQVGHWQRDEDLIGIRESAALAKLPAEERASCARLWAEVEALLRQTRGQQK